MCNTHSAGTSGISYIPKQNNPWNILYIKIKQSMEHPVYRNKQSMEHPVYQNKQSIPFRH